MEKNKEFNPQESEDSVGADPKGTVNNEEDLDSGEVVSLMMLLGLLEPEKAAIQLCMDKFSQTSCKIK